MSAATNGYILRYTLAGREQSVPVDRERVVIGRSPSCDLVIPEERISRQHATIYRDGDHWVVFDMGSANGTLLNDQPVTKSELRQGDVLTFGELRVTFSLKNPAASGASQVVVDRSATPANKTAVFDMAELSLISSISSPPDSRATSSQSSLTAAAWAVGLFNQAAQALLSSENLDDIFAKVLDLIFRNLPVERACIALLDEAGGLQPRSFRSIRQGGELMAISHSIAQEAISQKQAVIVGDAGSDARFGAEASILALNIKSAMCAPMYNEGRVSGVIYVDNRDPRNRFTEDQLRLLSTFGIFSAIAVEQTRLRDRYDREQRIRSRLAMYNSPAVVDRIVQGALDAAQVSVGDMMAEEKVATVIFSDLSGFTSMSEKLEPTEVAQLLNGIFEKLTDAVFAHEGTLDKFMGDGMMAFFGAPLDQPDHALRAVRAGLDMLVALARFNEQIGARSPVRMRIGINTGPVIVGDIGSPSRRNYTVIGDAVNVASRLESSVAEPGMVVIGRSTWELVKDAVDCRSLGLRALKGKEMEIEAFEVIALR
ncbi:MAG: FHA domain-containing protein [Planctomycetes bacterium]|nr:FHA domain-containing protein [Planctomycetota bacterium]